MIHQIYQKTKRQTMMKAKTPLSERVFALLVCYPTD